MADLYFYSDLGGGRFRATDATAGPWTAGAQHGGPPAALLLRALEREQPRPEMQFARISYDILGSVPVADVEVSARVIRPGRSVELVEASMRAGGREVMSARGWRVLRTAQPSVPPPIARQLVAPAEEQRHDGYFATVELRPMHGTFSGRGASAIWMRLLASIVEGDEVSPLQRLAAIADSGNGASAVLSMRRFWFINPELTLHVHREPVGEWILLDAETTLSEGGVGLCRSVLSDLSGAVGRGAQALFVAPR